MPDKVIQLVTTKPPEQYVCGDCFGALFHWYEGGRIVCIGCLAEYELNRAESK